MGRQVVALVTQKGDLTSFAIECRVPRIVVLDDSSTTRPFCVSPEMGRSQKGQDKAQDAGVHDQPCTVRLIVAPKLSGLISSTSPRTDNVTDIYGQPPVAQERPCSCS